MLRLDNCKCLNDIVRQEFGKVNYTNREKVKKILKQEGIDWRTWLEENKQKNKKYCLQCGKLLIKQQKKFCSSSCAAKYNNVRKKKKLKYCKYCGKILQSTHNIYCNNKCFKLQQEKEYIKYWKDNLIDGLSGEYQISNYIRNYLLKKHNYKCECCGWGEINQYTNTIPLEIHHKDGNYKNNKEENLQVLCPNCHSLTQTYKSHNKHGRKGRKKYYK